MSHKTDFPSQLLNHKAGSPPVSKFYFLPSAGFAKEILISSTMSDDQYQPAGRHLKVFTAWIISWNTLFHFKTVLFFSLLSTLTERKYTNWSSFFLRYMAYIWENQSQKCMFWLTVYESTNNLCTTISIYFQQTLTPVSNRSRAQMSVTGCSAYLIFPWLSTLSFLLSRYLSH